MYIVGLVIGVVVAICYRNKIRSGINMVLRKLKDYFNPPF